MRPRFKSHHCREVGGAVGAPCPRPSRVCPLSPNLLSMPPCRDLGAYLQDGYPVPLFSFPGVSGAVSLLTVMSLLVAGSDFSPLHGAFGLAPLSHGSSAASGPYQPGIIGPPPAWHGQLRLRHVCRQTGRGSIFCGCLHSCSTCIPVRIWSFPAAPGTLRWGSHPSDILFHHTRGPPVRLEGSRSPPWSVGLTGAEAPAQAVSVCCSALSGRLTKLPCLLGT